MNIKYLNESFKKLYEAAIDEEPQVNSNLNEIRTQLEDAIMRLQYRGATNIKEYEIAFQEAIENVFPDKSWWEITDCNIFFTLFETRSPELTLEQIIAELKPEYKEAVEENLEELLDADVNSNGTTNEEIELEESHNPTYVEDVIEWAYNDCESGRPVEDYREFSKLCADSGIPASEDLWQIYLNSYKEYNEEIEIDRTYHDYSEDELHKLGVFEESLKEQLEECLNKLNEAQISDEDKRDSDLIRSMLDKINKRSNAKFTPEEQAVLNKYGLERQAWGNVRNLTKDNVPLDRDVDSNNSTSTYRGKYNNGNKPMINYADRARKISSRRDNQVWGPEAGKLYRSAGNDWVNRHKSNWGYNPGNLQDAERDYRDAVLQEPVNNMKNALGNRKYNKKYMDSAQSDYDKAVAAAKKAYDDAVQRAEWSREQATTGYHKKGFDAAQGEIDKLLKRKPKED